MPQAPRSITAQETDDDIWDSICAAFPVNVSFTIIEAAAHLHSGPFRARGCASSRPAAARRIKIALDRIIAAGSQAIISSGNDTYKLTDTQS